jgi:putative holliday junction resolvase
MLTSNDSIMALDVGAKRIGVATANAVARIPHPLTTIENDDTVIDRLSHLIAEHDVAILVVGLPRGLNGQRTGQTGAVESFVETIKKSITLPLYWQDEAVTSVQAEAELRSRSKDRPSKGAIDALAATYILEDFLGEHPEASA